ncbi:MAG TPA: hypothetical protein VNO81_08135, partial [Candidatus Nitrosotenuis sp.]|jgi:lysophospholipase L1-like esterase|nr:hypothetical protein [Candidatus Nitrosotenuis sp.]
VLVALGDSITAGTQDGFTVSERQEHAYINKIARAAGVPFGMPMVGGEGIPLRVFVDGTQDLERVRREGAVLQKALAPLALWTYYVGAPPFMPPVWDWIGMGGRTPASRESKTRPQHNFAVPGFEVRHLGAIRKTTDVAREMHQGTLDLGNLAGLTPLVRAILQNGRSWGTSGSALDRAVQARPDLVVLWCGANDALAPIYAGRVDDRLLTPVEDRAWTFLDRTPLGKELLRTTEAPVPGFERSVREAVERLLRETSAHIVLPTIPDVTVVPAARRLGEPLGKLPYRVVLKDGTDVTDRLERWVIPNGVAGEGKNGRTHFPPGTTVPVLSAIWRFAASHKIETCAQFDAAMQAASSALFREDDVLDPDEQAQVLGRIQEYNRVLRQLAAGQPRLHLIEVNDILHEIQRQGILLRGSGPEQVRVTTTFTGVQVRGMEGIFSYDGLHPSDTGHAVIANMILDRVKAELAGDPRFAAFVSAPAVDELAAWRQDPHARRRQVLVMDAEVLGELKARLSALG